MFRLRRKRSRIRSVHFFPKLSFTRQRRSGINAGRRTPFSFQRAGRRLAGTTTVLLYASGFRGSSTFARLSTTRLPVRLESLALPLRASGCARTREPMRKIRARATSRRSATRRPCGLRTWMFSKPKGFGERSRLAAVDKRHTTHQQRSRILRMRPDGVKAESNLLGNHPATKS